MAKLIASACRAVTRLARALPRRLAPHALVSTGLALLAAPARAQDLSPIDTFFTTLGTALTGTTGRAIGLVALAAVGIAFLFGSATILGGFA